MTTLVLAMCDYEEIFIIETDSCDRGIGVVLIETGRPIAYFSKGLSPRNITISTYKKELLAVVMAVSKWKFYVQEQHFVIRIDQQSLKYFLEQRDIF